MSKKLGQYYTTNEELQNYVYNLVKNKGARLLEPSCGAGHLLIKFLKDNDKYPIDAYDIMPAEERVCNINIAKTDFLTLECGIKYKTIIGNPPYIKNTKGNLYIQFIEKCFGLLDGQGAEIIMIVPSEFIKATRAGPVIKEMLAKGGFTDFWFPNNERLFEGATIDVCVFRYEIGAASTTTRCNNVEMQLNENNGIITFSDIGTGRQGKRIEELFNVYVGLVTGKEEVFKCESGNMTVMNDKDVYDKYIWIDAFPSEDGEINRHMLTNKNILMSRKIRKFGENNWYEWGAPRNKSVMESMRGNACIYMRTMTRKKEVAFEGTVQYYGGSLLCLIPRVAGIDLKKAVEYMNTDKFQDNYIYSGRFKIGQKQLLNAIIEL
jgi:adenine-specific DNA-methyltransferase